MDIETARNILSAKITQNTADSSAYQIALDVLTDKFAPDFTEVEAVKAENATLKAEKETLESDKAELVSTVETLQAEKEAVVQENAVIEAPIEEKPV